MEIETLLHKEIVRELNELGGLDIGSDAYRAAVDGSSKLLDRAIELEKISIDSQEKAENREVEEKLKQTQMKEDRIDRWIKNGLSAAGIVLPIMLTVWGTKKSFEFEKEGTITTIMGRGFIQKMLPKK